MGFLDRLFPNLGKSSAKGKSGYTRIEGQHGLWFYVQCDRCGEKIAVRLRTTSEIQRREGPDKDEGPGQFFVRKTIVGSQCYQRIEATVDFDAKYNVVEADIDHGKLITYQEYQKETSDR
ncbi:MAG: hypothetical protein GX979_06850 [Firmicutes bacterium]|nr:hypothetical protein [Bacillota bacterium]